MAPVALPLPDRPPLLAERYAFVALSQHEIVGLGDLWRMPPCDHTLELRCDSVPAARDRGFATEAMTALIELSFARGWQRVVACTDRGRGSAARVAQKAGLRVVAVDESAHGLGWTWARVNPSPRQP